MTMTPDREHDKAIILSIEKQLENVTQYIETHYEDIQDNQAHQLLIELLNGLHDQMESFIGPMPGDLK